MGTMLEVTTQRLFETQEAIRVQRAEVARQSDPAARAIAARTLATLEDMLLIMQRTQGLLAQRGIGGR